MEILNRVPPLLLVCITLLVAVFAFVVYAQEKLFYWWREEVKRDRRAWLNEKKQNECVGDSGKL